MLRSSITLALLVHASALTTFQGDVPGAVGFSAASTEFSSMLNPDCELAPGKLVMMTELESEYLDNGMFANWYGQAHQFLNDKIQFLFDMPDASAVGKLRQLKWVPRDILYTDKNGEVKRLFDTPSEEAAPSNSTPRVLAASGRSGVVSLSESTDGFSAPTGSQEYKDLMRRRPEAVLKVLEKKCSVLHFDIDTWWVKSPFDELMVEKHDLLVTDDSMWNDRNMEKGTLCGCFLFWQPKPTTVELAKEWIRQLDIGHVGRGNQIPFNHALQANMDQVDYGIMAHSHFPPGKMVRKNKHNPKVVVLYHANWVVGIQEKIDFLTLRDMWHPEAVDKLPAAQ